MSQVKKKKQPKNAFYFFMIHYRSQEEARGVRFRGGMKDVAEKAAPIWKAMIPNERWCYEEEARKEKERDKVNLENKFTTQGKSYAQLEREKNAVIEYQIKMNQEIEGTVRSLDYLTSLPTYPFHLIHVNYYCRQESGAYTPCELAIAEFNFVDGIKRVYHTLINPGAIPLGYKYEADRHSAETHQIPVPPEEFGGEKEYVKILFNIKHFLMGPNRNGDFMPPLYTQPHCEAAVKNILCRLQESDGTALKNDDEFRVYPLPKLFYELRNACVSSSSGAIGFPAFSLAERELEKDVFNFTRGISCKFHEETDAIPHCSLSCVRRWGFLIMDHCCKDLGIDLVPGQHCPRQADTSRFKELKSLPPSRPSSVIGGAPVRSINPLKKLSIVDHGKLPPDLNNAMHFTLGSTPGIVTVDKQPEPKKQMANQDPLTPLRPPKTKSVALSLMTQAEFTEEDFPAIGSSRQREPAGVMNNEPVAVAGRGRIAAMLAYPIGTGRGRGQGTALEADFNNMRFN